MDQTTFEIVTENLCSLQLLMPFRSPSLPAIGVGERMNVKNVDKLNALTHILLVTRTQHIVLIHCRGTYFILVGSKRQNIQESDKFTGRKTKYILSDCFYSHFGFLTIGLYCIYFILPTYTGISIALIHLGLQSTSFFANAVFFTSSQ